MRKKTEQQRYTLTQLQPEHSALPPGDISFFLLAGRLGLEIQEMSLDDVDLQPLLLERESTRKLKRRSKANPL